jgi:PAS domain S-box-containing protein
MSPRVESRLHRTYARYLFALATVAASIGLRLLLLPLTGRGVPFAIFFAAVVATALFAGAGPGLCTLLLSISLAAYFFVLPAGYTVSQAGFQALLYLVDGLIILYLTSLMNRRRRTLDEANRALRRLRDEAARAGALAHDVIELAPDAFFLADLDARFTDVNQAACRLLGYDRDELIGKTIFDIIPAEDAERLKEVRTELLVPGRIDKADWTQRRKDGSLVPVEVSSNILPDGRWQAFVRDISEARRIADDREHLLASERKARRETEATNAQLRESEERFRLTIDEAPIGMALVALDGRFVRVNRVLSEITGYAPDELTKRTFADITHPDDVDTDVAVSRRLARGEVPRYHREKRYIRKDGATVDVLLHVSTLRGPDGVPLCFISQIEDITERKRAEAALRLSEAKFSGIVSIAADAIISVDRDQRITIFNEGAETIFGYSKTEMIGTQLQRLVPERLRAKHNEDFESFAASDESARGMADRTEVYGLRKSGEEFPAEASISKVAVGNAIFFSVVLRDITYRKNVEEALQRALAARDSVLRIVAHDLRNPLSAIMMQASAMERFPPEPERRDPQPRQVISRAARRMNQLIQDLMDVALVEAGELKIEPARLSVAELVRDAVQMQKPIADAADVEIRLDVAVDVREIWGDHNRLLQVFENLLGNAIKFTEGGGRIVVRAAPKDNDVEFSVSDTGAGIARDALAHIFDRFWQAATRAQRLGAGLGLPITKGIVEAHGGRIWVTSELGHGSSFFFTLPSAPLGAKPAQHNRRRRHRRHDARQHES